MPYKNSDIARKRANERNAKRYAAGICRTCPEERRKESATCAPCGRRHSEYVNAKYKKLKEAGLCLTCGDIRPTNRAQCDKCRETRLNIRRLQLQAGICQYCSNPLDNPELTSQCTKCRDRVAKRTSERIEAGLCYKCKAINETKSIMCAKCFFKNLAKVYLNSKSRWEELKNLFEAQGSKCMYSGELLVLGGNASIDHIVPVSKGGEEYAISNLCWATNYVNKAKSDMSVSEFLLMCYNISQHRPIRLIKPNDDERPLVLD